MTIPDCGWDQFNANGLEQPRPTARTAFPLAPDWPNWVADGCERDTNGDGRQHIGTLSASTAEVFGQEGKSRACDRGFRYKAITS